MSTLLLLALGACDGQADKNVVPRDDTPGYDIAASDKSRDLSPDVAPEVSSDLVEGNTAFAFDLYQEFVADTGGSFFYSPLSVSLALGMTWGGARVDTESQMASALHFTLPQEEFHPAMNDLDLQLAARNDEAWDQEIPVQLNVANSLWGQSGYPFVADFLDLLALNYGAGMYLVDFGADPNACRVTINDWVEDQTNERIKDLIPEGAISEMTRLVLVNAIYFNAAWDLPFDEETTADGDFTRLDGGTVTVPMMAQQESFSYGEGGDWQAIELPYDGDQLSMVVILPDDIESFEADLDGAAFADIVDGLEPAEVRLTLPKWGDETSFLLKDPLQNLGMIDAFDGAAADFTGISETGELYISSVIHKSFVAVDEAGTEAAAATAVIMDYTSEPDEIADLIVDHPFIYVIRDVPTGAVLFVGRLVDPS